MLSGAIVQKELRVGNDVLLVKINDEWFEYHASPQG